MKLVYILVFTVLAYTGFTQTVDELINHKGESVESVPHAQQIFKMKMIKPVKVFDILRMRKEDENE